MRTIALEESFWYDKLATEGSTVAHVRVKSAVAADWQHKLVDFTEYRLPDMDRNGVDMQVPSLTSPGIQVQPDPDIAVDDARTANDFLALDFEHPLEKLPSEYFGTNITITTTGVFSHAALIAAIQAVGVDNVMFSIDYPFESTEQAVQFIRTAPLAPADQARVAHVNAERILRLNQ